MKKKRKFLLSTILIFSLSLVTGCGKSNTSAESDKTANSKNIVVHYGYQPIPIKLIYTQYLQLA